MDNNDLINHPPHYTGFSNGSEVIDIAEQLNFNSGSAVKYISRAGHKPGADEVEDLKKAEWFIQREIDRLTREKNG